MNPITPTDPANTVTAHAIILAGLTALLLSAWMSSQPRRWLAAYWGIVLTGVATVWHRGSGQPFPGET